MSLNYVITYKRRLIIIIMDTEKLYQRALDLMEQGAEPDYSDLKDLNTDKELLSACQDIADISDQLRLSLDQPSSEDIDRKLKAFKRKHKRRIRLTIDWKRAAALVAAAVIMAIIMFFAPSDNDEEQGSLVFQAEPKSHIPMLTNNKGEEIVANLYDNSDKRESHIAVGDLASSAGKVKSDTMTLMMPNGKTCVIDLPDGSQVHLHPGSRLVFPQQFSGSTRDVFLEGQAYFVVAKDANRPFTVSTGKSVTKVIGTEFDVTAYKDAEDIVTLISGKVTLTSKKNNDVIAMIPGQQAHIGKDGLASVSEADTLVYTAWRDGFLYYDNASLKEILRQIGRCYNISITCQSPALLTYRMHFALKRDQDLSYVVDMLNRMKKVKASFEGNSLIIE